MKFWPATTSLDRRQNQVRAPNVDDDPLVVSAAVIPQRGSRAEVPGQQEIDVIRVIVTNELPGVDLWARAWYDGDYWDVVTPPAFHYGTRHTRHWSIDLRRRP